MERASFLEQEARGGTSGGLVAPGYRCDGASLGRDGSGVRTVASVQSVQRRYHQHMATDTQLAEMHAALADETRLKMLRALCEHARLNSGQLAALAGVAQTRGSQHLLFLKRAGLVT